MSEAAPTTDPATGGDEGDARPVKSHNVRFVVGLDHLRGFAAFLVVIHHAYWTGLGSFEPPLMNWNNWPKASNPLAAPFIEAHVAVAIFFVVSGFIFTLAGFGRQLSYGPYMRNRCLRVLPVFFVVLFFGLAMYPQRFELSRVLMTMTIFSDFPLQGLNLHPISTAFWTVAVEFQFYLIFPFLIAIYTRQGGRPLVKLLLLMVAFRVVGFYLGASQNPASPAASIRELNYWHLIPGHLDQFLIGMLGAQLYMRWKQDDRAKAFGAPGPVAHRLVHALEHRPWLCGLVGAAGFFGYVYALNQLGGYPNDDPWKIVQPTLEGLACFGLVLGYLAMAPKLPKLLDRVFTFLGDISFPTYIVHFAVVGLIMGDPVQPEAFPGARVDFSAWLPSITPHLNAVANTLLLVLPATIVLAYLLHAGVEAPFMKLRRRYVSDEAKS